MLTANQLSYNSEQECNRCRSYSQSKSLRQITVLPFSSLSSSMVDQQVLLCSVDTLHVFFGQVCTLQGLLSVPLVTR